MNTSAIAFSFCLLMLLTLLQEKKCSSFQTYPCNLQNNVLLHTRRTSFSRKSFVDLTQHNTGSISDSNHGFQSSSRTKTKCKRKRVNSKKINIKPVTKNPFAIQTWRIYGVEVDPDCLDESDVLISKEKDDRTPISIERMYLTQPVLHSLFQRLKVDGTAVTIDAGNGDDYLDLHLPPQLIDVRMVRRSLDARKKKVLGEGPRYTYVLDIDLTTKTAMDLKLKNQPGRNEIVTPDMKMNHSPLETKHSSSNEGEDSKQSSEKKKTVVIVGAGPAGLFCALSLAQSRKVIPILLERGQAVESRGKDIGALIHRNTMNSESNFAFGEGGAGTWSDGKLTTRIGRNSKNVRTVLETFVKYGAPEKILVDGAPHLGTDNLVKMLRNMRAELRSLGGRVIFGAKMTKIIEDKNDDTGLERITGVEVVYSSSLEKGLDRSDVEMKEEGTTEIIHGDAVVLATGHSARDVYVQLHQSGVKLEAKGFAAGFRVEHPQKVINKIQYGDNWGQNAYSGRVTTDTLNQEYFAASDTNDNKVHIGKLPVPSYRLATDKAFDGENNRGVYSFCMCPGGQIVIASTEENEVCVNGMSFSRRDSQWANSALVVTVSKDDPVLKEYREKYGVLAGIYFQQDMEKKASILGGGNFTVPVQRLTDFVNEETSTSAPSSSYRLGIKPSPCHLIYPRAMTKALQDAVINHFEKQMPGFLCEDALLHAVETRTSSPVRICRDPDTLQAIGKRGLYPTGEGAGFAGGIVSAAVDGLIVAEAILEELSDSHNRSNKLNREKSVGFEY